MTKTLLTWTVGTELQWQGTTYRILAVKWDALLLELQDLKSGVEIILEMSVLWGANPHLSPDIPASTLTSAGLPEQWLTKARQIIAVVETVAKRLSAAEREAYLIGVPFRHTESLKQIVRGLKPSLGLTSYYQYRRLYQQYGGDSLQIAASFRRSTYNQTRMSAAQLHFIDQIILVYGMRRPPRRPRTLYQIAQSVWEHTGGHWLDPQRCSSDISAQLVHELLDHDLPFDFIVQHPEKAPLLTAIDMPSQSWFYRYWHWFEAQPERGRQVFTRRYGEESWEQEMLVFDTFAHRATMPLQYVFADHWLVDVFTVDDQTRQERQRLWLTLLVDAYSRCILGMALLYEHPSILSIQSALYHAIWLKTSHQALELEGQWNCFGIPLQLFLDNAWAHHSYSLEDLARGISCGGEYNSMDLVFRPPYKGRYGALVERLFGNLSARMKAELPGAVVSSQPKAVGQAVQEACLLYDDVNRFLHREILTYLHTPHRELNGMTPHQKWQNWLATAVPRVPLPDAAVQRLFWRMHYQPRVITHEGVSAFGMKYVSPELSRAERIGRDGRPVFYHFRYDPQDISRLALFREGRWVCDVFAKELRLADGTYRAVSLAERKLAHAAARTTGSGRDWLRFVNEAEQLYRQRRREQSRISQPDIGRKRQITDLHTMTQALDAAAETTRMEELTQLLNQFLDEGGDA
jgi:hypothetical protein